MTAPRLIICERSPRWLAAWRRALPAKHWGWLAAASSGAQVRGRLQEAPGSVVALSVEAESLSAGVLKLHEWRRDFPRARFLALLSHDLAGNMAVMAALQEAGAIFTVDRRDQLRGASRLVQRHFRRHVAEELPWREAVRQRLPWPQLAVNSSSVS